MKSRHRLLFAFLLMVIGAVSCTVPAFAAGEKLSKEALTCDVYGGSFVLDDHDLRVLRNATSGDQTHFQVAGTDLRYARIVACNKGQNRDQRRFH